MARNTGKRMSKKRQVSEVTGDSYGLNEIDDFALKRDQVLLENSNLASQGADDSESNPDDEEEEVMAMSNEETSSEEEEEAEEEEEEQSDEELDGEKAYRKVFGRKLEMHRDPAEDEGGMLANDNAWGSTKGDYYGADDIDDAETAKEVEKEALRQKKKHLEELNMNDYMDDDLDEEWSKSAKEYDVREFKESTKQDDKTASIQDILNMDSEAKKNHLQTLFPEFIPLSKEMTQLSDLLEELKSQEESEVAKLKICALSTYLGTLSSYFGILLHELNNNETFATMRDHPVMEMILTSKEVWRQASSLPSELDQESESHHDDDEDMEDPELEVLDVSKLDDLSNKDIEESDQEESDQQGMAAEDEDQEDAEADDSEDDDDVDLDDFEEYVAQSRISKNKTNGKQRSAHTDDYVEGEMADVDSQEKKARKRTLRFYTSKIDQSENKKMDKFKGDDDIPYKERFFERQQRLLEEARKRGQHGPSGADLDTKDYSSGDEATSKAMNNASEKDYFNLTQKRRQEKKGARHQAHKEAVKAARDGKLAELAKTVGKDGKRAINYQILKNKGLTPKRKKDDRNSRVKKRKKYEKAQKKLKSVRAVYSGGQSGVYEGEKTGIKKNLIKSVKFKS